MKKSAKATGDFIVNKVAGRITKVSKNSQKNKSETVTIEDDKEIPKEDIHLQKKDRKLLII